MGGTWEGLLVLVIGLVTLLENMLGWNARIDQLLAKGPLQSLGTTAPNRMGTPASAGLALFGSALLLLIGGHRRRLCLAQALAAGLCLLALLGVMGFSYGAEELYAVVRWTAIAWPTALCLFVLGAGLLCTRPTEGLMAPVTAPDSGGIIGRAESVEGQGSRFWLRLMSGVRRT